MTPREFETKAVAMVKSKGGGFILDRKKHDEQWRKWKQFFKDEGLVFSERCMYSDQFFTVPCEWPAEFEGRMS